MAAGSGELPEASRVVAASALRERRLPVVPLRLLRVAGTASGELALFSEAGCSRGIWFTGAGCSGKALTGCLAINVSCVMLIFRSAGATGCGVTRTRLLEIGSAGAAAADSLDSSSDGVINTWLAGLASTGVIGVC